MKQTTKNIIVSSMRLLLFSSVALVAHSLTKPTPSLPEPTPITQQTAPILSSTPSTAQSAASVRTTATTQTAAQSSSPKADEIKNSVQHEYEYRIFATPNDPRYSSNWTFAKINAPAAWDISTGSESTTIAVIDTGFALNHEDLSSRWYTNQGETGMTQIGGRCWTGTSVAKQSNSCDDDNNGYVDDWRGWSFVSNDNNPQTGRQNSTGDGVRHGTQVAGIAGAAGNNGIGMTALNWNVRLMPLQALDDDGVGYTSRITAAIYYAVDNGAQVINLSLGTYGNDPALRTAINYAVAHNVVVVAAAGNCGASTVDDCAGIPSGAIAYPAAYPTVIAVGASTADDQRASFSSYGQAIDVSAPGNAIPSSSSWSAANQTSLYSGAISGTSFASPQVASLAALIKSIRPSTSVADITALIDATATKQSAMNGLFYTPYLGHGIINAGSALAIAQALGTSAGTPSLRQAGSYQSEHSAPTNALITSGCETTTACTVQLTSSAGYTRYLPYTLVVSGSTGWSWLSDSLDSDDWEIRARSGESVSSTPYYLLKKG